VAVEEDEVGDSNSGPGPGRGLDARAPWADLPELGLGDDARLVAELGSGAQTAVYRLSRADVDYTLKILRRVGSDDKAMLARFHREAALLARVDHPGVPKVFDVGSGGGRPYLLLEFIEGQPLSGLLETGPLGEGEVVRLAGDVAEALAAAHRAGLVHRDIKPANVIVAGSGQARLIDFGLAAEGAGGPSAGAVVGTVDYSAPEQTGMLARPVDGRADLYARRGHVRMHHRSVAVPGRRCRRAPGHARHRAGTRSAAVAGRSVAAARGTDHATAGQGPGRPSANRPGAVRRARSAQRPHHLGTRRGNGNDPPGRAGQ